MKEKRGAKCYFLYSPCVSYTYRPRGKLMGSFFERLPPRQAPSDCAPARQKTLEKGPRTFLEICTYININVVFYKEILHYISQKI